MASFSYIIKNPRVINKKNKKNLKLRGNPQKKAVCLRIFTLSPKKPNSANRKVIKVNLLQYNSTLVAKIPGENSALQQHSTVLIKGASIRDLIGVSHIATRGKFDLLGVSGRKNSRSLYGVKKSL
jgi:small subunit ribosomal protein S12|tara:strand:+ start:217 stop:591 length:375 start_codon:yes stop_codon:yes gene_type:complete